MSSLCKPSKMQLSWRCTWKTQLYFAGQLRLTCLHLEKSCLLFSKPSKQGKKEAEKLHDRKHIFWTHLKLLLCGWTSLFTQKTTTTHRIIFCQHARKRIAVGRKLAVSFKATLRTLSKHTSSHLYNMEVSQHTVPLLLLNPQLFYVQ